MTQVQPIQMPPYRVSQPTYNAVKIDIHNPQVNVPTFQEPPKFMPVTNPIYEYPQAPIYEIPNNFVYGSQETAEKQKAASEIIVPPPVLVPMSAPIAPIAPAPVIQAPVIQAPVIQASTIQMPAAPIEKVAAVQTAIQQISEPVKKQDSTTKVNETSVPAKTIEIKAPESNFPKVDINEFITKLTSPDYKQQADAMESIAQITQADPSKASELLDVKVFDALLNIMNNDTSNLEGPTVERIKIRENIMTGKTVSEAEMVEANKITPMELAERNKQYSLYTVAMLQKVYTSEIEKMNNVVVPLTELPGAAAIVDQVKNNPNPMIRVSGIDALSYIQRPEYVKDLTTIFTVAKKDQDLNVQQIATKALDNLSKAGEPQKTTL